MRRTKSAVAAAVLLLFGTTAVAAPGRATAGSRFSATDCVEAMAFFLIEPQVLQQHIPDRFQVAEVVPGRGELLVTITKCAEVSFGGGAGDAAIFSEVGIYIEEPEEGQQVGAQGFPYYQLWHLTNLSALGRALTRLGIEGGVVADATFSSGSPFQAQAAIPWKRVSYSMDAVNPARTTLFTSRPSTWWHLGKRGLVATVYTTQDRPYQSGTTLFETSEGPLAAIIGARSGLAHQGVLAGYESLTATTTLL